MKKILFSMMLVGTVFIASNALAGGKEGEKKSTRINSSLASKAKKSTSANAAVNAKQTKSVKPLTKLSNTPAFKAKAVEPVKQHKK